MFPGIRRAGGVNRAAGLLPIQQWYLEKDPADICHFNQSVLLKIDKSATYPVLQAAVNQLVLHHDALRFMYYQKDGHWQQEYTSGNTELITEDLRAAAPAEAVRNVITNHASRHQRSLDIEKGTVMRVVWMQTPGSEEHDRLLIVIHHLA
jgi:hypothetical protein